MQLIKQIQRQIQAIYGIRVDEDAGDYLINRDELIALLPVNQQTVIPKELFLVNPQPQNDTLEIALFFDESLTANLATHDPLQKLSRDNISDFCTLIEGVSHFVYYLHKASLEHDISQLELELQAEIDKFILLSFCVNGDQKNHEEILDMLFEDYRLHHNLTPQQQERYQTFTQLARKYCFELLQNFKTSARHEFLQEIRSFYPLRQEQKIQYILS